MRRTLTLLCLLAVAAWGAACGGGDNANDNSGRSANNSNATRNGVVETNANIPKNLNANSAPSNVGVLMNDNGNKNTEGVASMNNSNHKANDNKNHNANHNASHNANH